MSNALHRVAPHARAVFSRYWIASAALLVFIVAAALVQFARVPREYVATQQLHIVIFTTGSNNATNAAPDAASLATTLADPSILSSPRLASDMLAGVPPDMADVSASALQGALAGGASGATLSLSATWSSPQGANELLSAAVTALQTDASLLPSSAANDSVRILPGAPANPATQSTAQADALDQTLIQRILMALVAACLLPFVLAALLPARRTAATPQLSR